MDGGGVGWGDLIRARMGLRGGVKEGWIFEVEGVMVMGKGIGFSFYDGRG